MEQQKYAQLSETNPVLYTIGVISFILIFLFLAGFLNFISTLYSDIDISKIDLSRVSRRKKKIKMAIYIIKNNYFLFVGTSILSVILNIINTRMLTDFGLLNKYVEIFLIFLFVIITELLVRYFAEREFSKKRTLSPFLLNSAYIITRIVA